MFKITGFSIINYIYLSFIIENPVIFNINLMEIDKISNAH